MFHGVSGPLFARGSTNRKKGRGGYASRRGGCYSDVQQGPSGVISGDMEGREALTPQLLLERKRKRGCILSIEKICHQ